MQNLHQELKQLSYQADCQCGCHKEALETVNSLLQVELLLGDKLRAYYIKGKCHWTSFLLSGQVEDVETSNSSFDQLFILHPKSIEQKYWFKRIKTKFELSQVLKGEGAAQLTQTAIELLKQAQTLFPYNSSFVWLEQEYIQ